MPNADDPLKLYPKMVYPNGKGKLDASRKEGDGEGVLVESAEEEEKVMSKAGAVDGTDGKPAWGNT